jgi:hypothetical protein
METSIIKKDRPDSVELGTAKLGVMKVYFDASNIDEAKILIKNAAEALTYAMSVKNSVSVTNEPAEQ